MKLPILRKSREKFSCEQGQDGKIICKSFREFDDGTRTPLAEIHFEFDGNCQGVATVMNEDEEGALAKLEKKAYGRIQSRCRSTKNKPADY